MVFNVIGAILKLTVMLTYFIKNSKSLWWLFALLPKKVFLYVSFFFTLERFHKPKGAFETYDWRLSFWRLWKMSYWLCDIIDKAQNVNFNQYSLIGCLGLNLDSVIAFFPHRLGLFFGSTLGPQTLWDRQILVTYGYNAQPWCYLVHLFSGYFLNFFIIRKCHSTT